jgi:chemotaxis methyl-accepting protein methylase
MPDIDDLNFYIAKISFIILNKHQKDILVFDQDFLKKTLERRICATAVSSADEYCTFLMNDPLESSVFMKSLNNTFSHFFRGPLAFAYLEQHILPSLVALKAGGEIRIWSAGCAAGQEAFSVAMLISDIAEAGNREIRYRIIATDTSEEALGLAKTAVFDANAIRNVTLKHLNKYFVVDNFTYTLLPSIKKQVEFAEYDLLDSSTAFPPESI